MRISQDYLQLRKSFPDIKDEESFQVSMSAVAEALYCTPRNAKNILNKMMDLNWVLFVPGRGRGHTSELKFLQNRGELLLRQCKELVKKGEVESAFQLMRDFREESIVKTQFIEWFSNYFGYQVDNQSDRYYETLKLPIYRPINTLDPAKSYYAFDSHMIKQLFNTLVEYDYETNQIIGGIAHHWNHNDQKSEWIFYLKKGVYFHNGRELEARDVQFSLNRLKDSTHGQNWLVRDVDRINILSKYTIKIYLTAPNSLFLLFMSFAPTSIVPSDCYQQSLEFQPNLPIGTGPYKAAKRTQGLCVLEAFDHYFQGRALIDRIEIINVPDSSLDFNLDSKNNNLLMVRTGENNMDSQNDWNMEQIISGISVMTINLKKNGILQDINLRKALHHLVNREQMIVDLGETRVYPSNSFQLIDSPSLFDHDYNPKLGVSYLAKSTYEGQNIQLYTYQRHSTDAYWLQREYLKYGIKINVTIISWSDLLNRENIEAADLILFEAVLREGLIRKIEYYLSSNSPLKMHMNQHHLAFVNHQIDKVLKSSNPEIQQQQLQMIDQMLNEDNALIYLVYRSVSTVSHASLQNVRIHPRGWVDFNTIWFQIQED